MAKKKSSILVNTLVMVIVSAVAVAALAVVNQITAEPIAQAEMNNQASAYTVVYEDAKDFEQVEGADALIESSASLLEENGFGGCSINEALVVNDGEGYVIVSTSPNGYGGDVQVAIGIKDDKLTGFYPVANNETPGFGANCVNPEFTEQFAEKAAAVLSFTKDGASSDTEIDALSGATITTKAVTEAVNSAVIFYQANFGGGVQEIEGPDLTEFYQQAYPEGNEFTDVENAEAMIEESAALLAECGLETCTIKEVKAVNGGEGYVVSSTGLGYGGESAPIQIVIGIKDNKITGYSVVSHMETEGFGAACDDEPFAGQFAGKDAKVQKKIDAISGATFTTNGVKNAVNAAIVFYQTNLGDGSITIDKSAVADTVVDVEAGATAQ